MTEYFEGFNLAETHSERVTSAELKVSITSVKVDTKVAQAVLITRAPISRLKHRLCFIYSSWGVIFQAQKLEKLAFSNCFSFMRQALLHAILKSIAIKHDRSFDVD